MQRGQSDQECQFGPGHYVNAGPARIPGDHTTILSYAKQLRVPLEVMVNVDRRVKFDVGGVEVPGRQPVNDARGRFSQLLAKAVNKGALDQELTGIDKEKLLTYLRTPGELDPAFAYARSQRSGFSARRAAMIASRAPRARSIWLRCSGCICGAGVCCLRKELISKRRCCSPSADWTGSPMRSSGGCKTRCAGDRRSRAFASARPACRSRIGDRVDIAPWTPIIAYAPFPFRRSPR